MKIKGTVLLVVLVFLALSVIVSAVVLSIVNNRYSIINTRVSILRSTPLAYAGLNRAIYKISQNDLNGEVFQFPPNLINIAITTPAVTPPDHVVTITVQEKQGAPIVTLIAEFVGSMLSRYNISSQGNGQ